MWRSIVRPRLRPALPFLIIAALMSRAAVVHAGGSCVGDCRNVGAVTIADLIVAVNIALGSSNLGECAAIDRDGNARVTIDELIAAVKAALTGCAAADTPTQAPNATASATVTITASPHATTSQTPPATATIVPTETPTAAPPATATPTNTPSETATIAAAHFCDLPGSLVSTGPGTAVAGPSGGTDVSYVHLPIGFCAHFFGRVNNARGLRFAPGGELFVASPTRITTGNGQGGKAAIIVLPDDDHDGVADGPITFLGSLPETVGLLFANDSLYYQDGAKIRRLAYAAGDRTAAGPGEVVATVTVYDSFIHWPKALDMADDGTIYVANGGDDYETCTPEARPFHGGILKLDGSAGGTPVAKGFRNPISIRCQRGHNLCFAVELARDFSNTQGGREKIVPIRDGDDWGFPCCATRNTPYGDLDPTIDCSGVAAEPESFYIGHTPFDLDFEMGKWPEPWKGRAFVPLHGAYNGWQGARIVAIEADAMSGQLLPGSDLSQMSMGAMTDFATGWDDGTQSHGRPAVVAFASDGRLFLGNDRNGDIIWIAPVDLEIPQ